jgi:Phage tail assembly chaperone protein
MKIYLLDSACCFAGEADIDPMLALPPCTLTPPPSVNPPQIQQWTGIGWVILETRPAKPEPDSQTQAVQVRAERNAKLKDCDWTQLPDAPVDTAAWAAYRQALRGISAQPGFPFEVNWPEAPQ